MAGSWEGAEGMSQVSADKLGPQETMKVDPALTKAAQEARAEMAAMAEKPLPVPVYDSQDPPTPDQIAALNKVLAPQTENQGRIAQLKAWFKTKIGR